MGNCIYKSDDISLYDADIADMDASVYDTHGREEVKSKEVPKIKHLTSKPH